jgi:hypothetical protein
MSRLRGLGAFARDFVLGDDPLMFVVAVVGLAVTAAVQALGVAAWWVLPVFVIAALAASVLRARPPT